MPPKKGKGRGRGGPSELGQHQEKQPVPGTSRGRGRGGQSSQQRPQGFFQPQSQTAEPHEPKAVAVQQKRSVQTAELESIGLHLEQRLELSTPLPKRPGYGTLGRRIKLKVNFFPIQIPSGYVYHYDIEIIPIRKTTEAAGASGTVGESSTPAKYRCLSTKINRTIFQLMVEGNENFSRVYPAYDGKKNMYTRHALGGAFTCRVSMPNENDPSDTRRDEFEIRVKPVNKKESNSCAISLDTLHALFEKKVTEVPQEAFMALETILRHGPCLKFTPVGRSFFYPPDPNNLHPLGGGREIWFGYHQSVRIGQWMPFVNVNITATSFYEKGPLLNFIAKTLGLTMEQLARLPSLRDSDIKRLNGELKNMRIEVTHLPYRRKYRILRLVRDSADRLKFKITNRDGATIETTVQNYFQSQYRLMLRFPRLPCVQVNPENKKVYLPIEVCELIEGQHCRKKLDDRQTAEMIKVANKSPVARFTEIEKIVREKANYNRDQINQEFDIKVSTEPLKVEGRILTAPSVQYKNDRLISPVNGVWRMGNEIKFYKGASIGPWVCLCLDARTRTDSLSQFCQMLVSFGKGSGIEIERPVWIETIRNNVPMKSLLERMCSQFHAEFALIVIPTNDKSIYGVIKQAAEKQVGIKTQCVKSINVFKCKADVVSNLLQKINAKMGGINNSLCEAETPAIFRKPVIIIGADVTHPGPTHEIKPSIAACVGSLDSRLGRYAVTVRAQTNVNEKKESVEIICDLQTMVVELLKAFYRSTNGLKPEKIIFYRDGVSEGQFKKVKDHEVEAIRKACRSLGSTYQPQITFVVVQKRHHTRFFPEDIRDGVGTMKNVPPGTTVDTKVTHPVNFDFFLCSHFGLQGTSKPAHYTVIEDDNKYTADDLQKLTYYLCHFYARCTRSISIPAPVQYAHLAAYRARQYLTSLEPSESTTVSSDSDFKYHELPERIIEAIKVMDNMKTTMYFV